MTNDLIAKDPLALLIEESEAYVSVPDIEKLIQGGANLGAIPIQPLYLSLKNTSHQQIAELLPKLAKEQREVLLDLDLWNKDNLDIFSFESWPLIYNMCQEDNVVEDFVQSEQFLLYIKSKFNIWTFDVEDPMYPEHDNYFLTEDNLLLFEFEEDYPWIGEIKNLVRRLYSTLGVNDAYKLLFKIVSESHSVFQEECFDSQKERLRDFGFVNYYEALQVTSPFSNISLLKAFLKKKTSATGSLDSTSKMQTLHRSALTPFRKDVQDLSLELGKLENEKRKEFVQFTFVRLVNSTLEFYQALKEGTFVISRVGNQTKDFLKLGFEFIKMFVANDEQKTKQTQKEGIFSVYDFNDLYRTGNTLIFDNKKKLKKALKDNCLEVAQESFLGKVWNDFLDLSFQEIPQIRQNYDQRAENVNDLEKFKQWEEQGQLLITLLPFIQKFNLSFNELLKADRLQNQYYLNYTIDQIDFEAIIVTSIVNFYLGALAPEKNSENMGISVDQLKGFVGTFWEKDENNNYSLYSVGQEKLYQLIDEFIVTFGFGNIAGFSNYLKYLLDEHLSGYNFDSLVNEEFKHVGGPILLRYSASEE